MRTIILATLLASVSICRVADARSYVPLGALQDTPASTQGVLRSVKNADRPLLAGTRPVELELLEDALRRKMPRTVGASREKAHERIIRNALRDPVKRSHMRGILAEALYLGRNPEWGYVNNPTASQHDIYKWVAGRRTPFTAQIKTHASGDARLYAQDMVVDHRSDHFKVPDNHVRRLEDHWRSQFRDLKARGFTAESVEAQRQLDRVRGLGFTSKELDDHLSNAARYSLRERNAGYVTLGAGIALAVTPDLLDWWRGGTPGNEAMFRIARAGSILATERATTLGLARFGTGALRGTLGGNAISGLAMLATDTSFSIYENGGAGAFRGESFYTHLGASIGGLALGMTVGTPVSISVTTWASPIAGPWAPAVGGLAGLATGAVAGAAGYLGGEVASRRILEVIDPDFLHDAENAMIRDARDRIERSIRDKVAGP